MKPRICIPLPAKTLSDLALMIQKAENAGADLIEIRLDYMSTDASNVSDELEKIVKQSSVPLIATNRQYGQGGCCPQSEDQRIKNLIRSAEIGFEYVDLELTTIGLESVLQRVKDYGAKPLVSFHDFKCTPAISEMEKIVKAQIEAKAEICKLVTTANDVADNVKCMILTWKMSQIGKIVCFAMGKKGILSRVLSPLFGAYFTYASLESGLETASGQISIIDLREVYGKLGVDE